MTPSMTRLVQELMRLPGIGEKTAGRLAFEGTVAEIKARGGLTKVTLRASVLRGLRTSPWPRRLT